MSCSGDVARSAYNKDDVCAKRRMYNEICGNPYGYKDFHWWNTFKQEDKCDKGNDMNYIMKTLLKKDGEAFKKTHYKYYKITDSVVKNTTYPAVESPKITKTCPAIKSSDRYYGGWWNVGDWKRANDSCGEAWVYMPDKPGIWTMRYSQRDNYSKGGRRHPNCHTGGPTKEQNELFALACCLGLETPIACHHQYCLGSPACYHWLEDICTNNLGYLLEHPVCARWVKEYKPTYGAALKEACKREILTTGSYADMCKNYFLRNQVLAQDVVSKDICEQVSMKNDPFCACVGWKRINNRDVEKRCTETCARETRNAFKDPRDKPCNTYICDQRLDFKQIGKVDIGNVIQTCNFEGDQVTEEGGFHDEHVDDTTVGGPKESGGGGSGGGAGAGTGTSGDEGNFAEKLINSLGLNEMFKDFDSQTKMYIVLGVIALIIIFVFSGSDDKSGSVVYAPAPVYY